MGSQVFFTKVKPYFAMLFLQFGYSGMSIITMFSLKRGLSHFTFVVYRHAIATIAIAPFALVIERKIRPKMTISIFLKILLLGFLEPVLDQNLYVLGMKYTSATFASAIVNMLPAVTYIMAIILRLERVKLNQVRGLAKVIGTVITVSGALLMTLYKGPIVNFMGHSSPTTHSTTTTNGDDSSGQHWVTGTLMLLACICGWSAFFILQSITVKEYPAELSLTTLICLMGMLEGAAVALAFERDMSAWVLGWDSRLLAAVYSGVVCSGIAYYVQSVVNRERGPVFVTVFSPICMIITAILGAILLSEQVHLGSMIGALIVVMGLYAVVWGKGKDELNSNNSSNNNNSKFTKAQELPVVLMDSAANDNRSTTTLDHCYTNNGSNV